MLTQNGSVFRSSVPAPPVEPSLVVHALRHAAVDPGRAAIVDGATGERLSRAELVDLSGALAAGLEARGIGRGDLVAVALPNGLWWPVVALATWRAGAALMPLSTRWTADELGRLLARVRPRLAVASTSLAPAVRDALASAGLDAEVSVHGGGDGAPLERLLVRRGDHCGWEPRLAPGTLALVPFSSGTGGLPKGVRLTHGGVAAAAAQGAEALSLDAHSVLLTGAPFFHALGLVLGLCAPLRAGAQVVTLPVPRTEPILELIAQHRVTHAAVAPAIVADLAADPAGEDHRADTLELLTTGGAPLPPAALLGASERLGCLARQGYGMTETTAVISGIMGRRPDPETVGWLCAGTEARLVDPETGRDVGPGAAGELWVRGPQLMDGYHDDPVATADAIAPGGWLRTGDLVTIRDDGQLVVEDRLKDLIKVKAAQVSPAELELVLREHPSIRDAGVVGRPHPEHGEVPVAYVVLRAPATPEELVSFVAGRVAGYKRVREVRIVDELPRDPGGKLRRRRLRAHEREAVAR
jgi:acyl-CoA synthetase (AMP-forming)/AMP-acid ligase II